MNSDVEAWLKKTRRKGPFWLLNKEPIEYRFLPDCMKAHNEWRAKGYDGCPNDQLPMRTGYSYEVIWKEDDKTKIGKFSDGMHTRYGIKTYGWVRPFGDDDYDIWGVTKKVAELLKDFNEGKLTLYTEFDPSTLKDLTT